MGPFGDHGLGHEKGGRGADDGGGQKMTGRHAEHDIGREDTASDGCHSSSHQCHEFASGHCGEVGFDDHGGFRLSHEDVGRRSEAFAAADVHEAAHDPGHPADNELENAIVIEKGGKGGDEDDGPGDADGEEEGVFGAPGLAQQIRFGEGPEDHGRTLISEGEEFLKSGVQLREQGIPQSRAQNQPTDGELQARARKNRPPGRSGPVGRQCPGSRETSQPSKNRDPGRHGDRRALLGK